MKIKSKTDRSFTIAFLCLVLTQTVHNKTEQLFWAIASVLWSLITAFEFYKSNKPQKTKQEDERRIEQQN